MDERIEAFLLEMLEDEGKGYDIIRENTRRYLATYEEISRRTGASHHKKEEAFQRCRIGAASACWKKLITAKVPKPQTICGSF